MLNPVEANIDFCLLCVKSFEEYRLNNSAFQQSETNILDKLQSDSNMSAWNFLDCDFPGKGKPNVKSKPMVAIEYEVADCEDGEFDDCEISVCDDSDFTFAEKKTAKLSIDMCVAHKFTLTCKQFKERCEGLSETWGKELATQTAKMKVRKEKKVLQAMHAAMNLYPVSQVPSTGGTTIEIPIVTPTGQFNDLAEVKISETYAEAGWMGEVCTIGGKITRAAAKLAGKGCPCPDGTRPNIFEFTTSSNLDECINTLEGTPPSDSWLITFPLGACGVVNWLENRGDCAYNYPQTQATTITLGGETYDYWVKFIDCDEPHYNVVLKQRFCIVDATALPDAYCPGKGPLKLLWKGICGDVDTCDALKPC